MTPVLFLVGPTASGKSAVASYLAEKFNAEIISLDSRQNYRYMSIGTAQPDQSTLQQIPHHFIAELNPSETWNAFDCSIGARKRIDEIVGSGRRVICAGGTGLYFSAVRNGIADIPGDPVLKTTIEKRLQSDGGYQLYAELTRIDPESAQKMDPTKTQRLVRALEVYYLTGKSISWWQQHVQLQPLSVPNMTIGFNPDRNLLTQKIRDRVSQMIRDGLELEVRNLLSMGYQWEDNCLRTVGYTEWKPYFSGEFTLTDLIEKIVVNTRRYAKRQMTWFRKEESIHWINRFGEDAMEECELIWTNS